MHEKLMKLMEKKKGPELSDAEKEAKRSVLMDMKKMAEDSMGDKLQGLKKVTVASNTPSGLEHGLDKAKEILSKKEEYDSSDDSEDMEDESADDMENEYSDAEDVIQNCSDMDELNKLEEMIKAKKMEMMK